MKNGLVEHSDGSKVWYLNGQLHREDGPAIEFSNGSKHWYINGKLHREDGPACEYSNGDKFWYLNGESLTEEEFNRKVKSVEKSEQFSRFQLIAME